MKRNVLKILIAGIMVFIGIGLMANINTKKISAQFYGIFDNDWDAHFSKDAPFNKVDILYIAFAHTYVNEAGKPYVDFEHLNITPTEKLRCRTLVQTARAKNPNIKIVISLGWGHHDLAPILKDPTYYARSVVNFLRENRLDGFDIDYESPDISSTHDFETIVGSIKRAMNKSRKNYLFTITPDTKKYIGNCKLHDYFNYINVQCYWYSNIPNSIDEYKDYYVPICLGDCSEPSYGTVDDVSKRAAYVGYDNVVGIMAWRMDTDPGYQSLYEIWWYLQFDKYLNV